MSYTNTIMATRRQVIAAASAAVAASATDVASQGAPATAAAPSPKRVVFVVSNPAKSPTNGMEVGYWLPELAHPYHAFSRRGYALTVASPRGGEARHDAISDPEGGRFADPGDLVSLGFKHAKPTRELTRATTPLVEIRVEDHDAIVVVGGLAPPVTFTGEERLHRLFAGFHEAGKVAAALCHGSLVLLKARLSNGRLLAEGRRWTGYCNLEEDVVDKAMGLRFQPYRIEDEARAIAGTTFVQGPPYKPFAVADGRLITGQQGSSGTATADLVIKALDDA